MTIKKVTIIIPCYNEEKTIVSALKEITAVDCGLIKQIIIVDDGSVDNTRKLVQEFKDSEPQFDITLISHSPNRGKGASIASAMAEVKGEIVVIQDADLEYDPQDYTRLFTPIIQGYADVVYGSRFKGSEPHRVLFFSHTIGNRFLTFLSNVFTGINLSDMETGYKVFRTDILRSLRLVEKRFGFEPEVTAKISRIKAIRIYEIGVSYKGRTYVDGKKIKMKDAFRAVYCILKYNIFSRK